MSYVSNYQTHVCLCIWGPYARLTFVPNMLSSWKKLLLLLYYVRLKPACAATEKLVRELKWCCRRKSMQEKESTIVVCCELKILSVGPLKVLIEYIFLIWNIQAWDKSLFWFCWNMSAIWWQVLYIHVYNIYMHMCTLTCRTSHPCTFFYELILSERM